MIKPLFAELTDLTIKMNVCAHVKELVRNTQKGDVLKKKIVLDVLEFLNLFVVKKESLMITSVT